MPNTHWHHVAGLENPADCASRGITVSELNQHSLWWHGPPWLSTCSSTYKDSLQEEAFPEECLSEERLTIALAAHGQPNDSILDTYSSLSKLTRITAYIKRFIHNSRCKTSSSRVSGPLTPREIESALFHWVQTVQAEHFSKELHQLSNQKPLSNCSKVLQLHPFIDKDNLLRVGGRLRHSSLPEAQRHPILLPKQSKLTTLIIESEHLKYLHAGPQLLRSILQQRFWILGIRDAIRFHIHRCVTCIRQRAATAQQMMADLPPSRVTAARPFTKCGVDYAGPFLCKVIKGRGHKSFKVYIAIFICFVTRAVHIELVSDLSSDAFLAALKRFISRRGKCSNLYSDCGTNFIGADRELRKLLKSTNHQGQIANWLATEGIQWHFNPPSAPHFGGLWEAGVRSLKSHLKRVLGISLLNFEEFQTLLCQIEACMNSRPLSPLSSDPNDFSALTPGHFLIGEALTTFPEPDLTDINFNRLSHWQKCQQLLQHFWRRWSNEFLNQLQQRPKWLRQRTNLAIGMLVLLKDENLPPTRWKLGRILSQHPGSDGCVRVVTVQTADSQLKRPIVKLCPLPFDINDQAI